jgi:hypothetical protein
MAVAERSLAQPDRMISHLGQRTSTIAQRTLASGLPSMRPAQPMEQMPHNHTHIEPPTDHAKRFAMSSSLHAASVTSTVTNARQRAAASTAAAEAPHAPSLVRRPSMLACSQMAQGHVALAV